VAQVIVSPRAKRDVDEAISTLDLPGDTWSRIARSLRVLETFPLSGPELGGRWAPTRFVLGPWSWMLLLYRYDEASDRVFIVSMHDARSAASPRSSDSRSETRGNLRERVEGLREEWR
jgi:hypothetical protein